MNDTGHGIAVLGGSGGLGEGVVHRLARRAPLTIGYRSNAEKAEELVRAVTEAGGRATSAQVDMTDGASVKTFIAKAVEDWGQLDAVVSATGPAIPLCALEDVTDEDFKRIMDADVYGSFNVVRHATDALRTSGGGSIVLFLTTAILRTLENDGMSGIPKTAVSGILRQAAREAGEHNVRINGVAPGVIDAGIVLTSFEVDETAKSVIASCMAQTPLGRMGRPEEVAALVDFLTSSDATYISGQVIAVDGGYSA
jgi:NAD(P)-dependent dehydrogenase (short-subunit alcohol dehydrogenase family)